MKPTFPESGTSFDPVTRGPVTLDLLKLYARASGDHNPIHTDEAVAKKVGLPGVIAHGMLSAGLLASRATEVMKPWNAEWKLSAFQSRFKAMTLLGETIRIAGSFKSVSADLISLELTASNPRGEVTTQALAEFRRGT